MKDPEREKKKERQTWDGIGDFVLASTFANYVKMTS